MPHCAATALSADHGIQIGNDGLPFPKRKRRIEAALLHGNSGDLDLKTGFGWSGKDPLPQSRFLAMGLSVAHMRWNAASRWTLGGAAPLPHSCQTGQRALQDQNQATVVSQPKEPDGSHQAIVSPALCCELRRVEGTVPGPAFMTTREGEKAKAVRLGGMPSALLACHPLDAPAPGGRFPLGGLRCEALQAALAQHSARQTPT